MTIAKYSLALCLLLAACSEEEDAAPPPQWSLSQSYVSQTLMLSDAALDEAVRDEEYDLLDEEALGGKMHEAYRAMALRMHLRQEPALYTVIADTRSLPQAAAHFTQGGRPYILVNDSGLSQWSDRQLIAVLGHELVHIKERHVTAERIAEAYNQPGMSIRHELEADAMGSGPLGSCDPEALKEALTIVHDADRQAYNIQAAGNYDDLISSDHPSWQERMDALDARIADPPEECRNRQPLQK